MDYRQTNDLHDSILRSNETRDLYEILGLENKCSQDELKKSYRKLVMMYHPDRITPSSNIEKFQSIQNAYEILSDIKKREIYDTYGIVGINMYCKLGDSFISEIIFDHKILCKFYLIITIILILFLTQIILIAMKINNQLSLNWLLIIIPSTVFSILLLSIINYIGFKSEKEDKIYKLITANFIFLLLYIQIILLSIKIQYENIKFVECIIPLLFCEVIFLVMNLKNYDLEINSIEDKQLKILTILNLIIPPNLRYLFYILLILRLDISITISWGLIMAPLYCNLFIYNCIIFMKDFKYLETIVENRDYNNQHNLLITKNLISLFISIIIGILLIFININLEEHGLYIGIHLIMLPIYIFLTILIWCFSCCLPLVSHIVTYNPEIIPEKTLYIELSAADRDMLP